MIFWSAVTIRLRNHATPKGASAKKGVSPGVGRIDAYDSDYVKWCRTPRSQVAEEALGQNG
jgi:hypothetical protein